MASSNIKLFDENKGNMLSDSEFNISNQRLNGLQTGVASSQLQNKAMYQASLIAYAIAQVMMQNGKNANDTDAVSAFVANLSGTMLQKVYDIASTAEAQAGVATGKWMSPALVKAAIDTLAAKAQNILSNETKALFGLGADAVPDDVLSMLYRAANYAWKRRAAGYVEKRTAAPSGVRFNLAYGTNSVNCSQTVEYSEEIEINSTTGAISLKNPQTLTIPWSGGPSIAEVLKGKYVKNTYSSPDDIVFISASATINNNSSSSAYWVLVEIPNSNVFIISSEITAQGDWSIVYAPGRSTYPDNGISNGYEYVFLGNPLDNAISPQKIETGSYVGTGESGSGNPNSLTFSFVPKVVIIGGTASGTVTMVNASGGATYGGNSSGYLNLSWDDKTVSWYYSGSDTYGVKQFNSNQGDRNYYYLAIG